MARTGGNIRALHDPGLAVVGEAGMGSEALRLTRVALVRFALRTGLLVEP